MPRKKHRKQPRKLGLRQLILRNPSKKEQRTPNNKQRVKLIRQETQLNRMPKRLGKKQKRRLTRLEIKQAR